MKINFFIVVILLGFCTCSHGASPDSIQGLWRVPQDGTLIKIDIKDGLVEGTVFRRPHDRIDEIDKFNPIQEQRKRPIIGLKVLSNLKNYKQNSWKGGLVYDPDSGSTYHAQAHLKDLNTLAVRGYIGIPLFGRTAILTRF